MSGYLDSLNKLRPVMAAATAPGRAPRTRRPVARRVPERCPAPVRSAVLPRCDGLAAMAAVLMTMPRWLAVGYPVALLIRATRAGGLMQITKLRAITVQNPDAGWTVSHDQCTTVSRLLRSTHLMELPQLLNEIRGQMSLVGPRPERPHLTLLKS